MGVTEIPLLMIDQLEFLQPKNIKTVKFCGEGKWNSRRKRNKVKFLSVKEEFFVVAAAVFFKKMRVNYQLAVVFSSLLTRLKELCSAFTIKWQYL